MSLSRRQFIKASGVALCAGAVPLNAHAAGQQPALPVPPLLESRRGQPLFLTLQRAHWSFTPGTRASVWGVNGRYLGPTIRVWNGDDVKLIYSNRLTENVAMTIRGLQVPGPLTLAAELAGTEVALSLAPEFVAALPVATTGALDQALRPPAARCPRWHSLQSSTICLRTSGGSSRATCRLCRSKQAPSCALRALSPATLPVLPFSCSLPLCRVRLGCVNRQLRLDFAPHIWDGTADVCFSWGQRMFDQGAVSNAAAGLVSIMRRIPGHGARRRRCV